MKKTCLLVILLLSLQQLKSQTISLSSMSILPEDSTLLVTNSDTSYVFNAYVLTQVLSGISSVTLVCEDYSVNAQWVPVKDTVYTWSLVTVDSLSSYAAYGICKPNDNLLKICLGRLYYAYRHRYTFTITGANGVLTREFIF